MPAWMHSIDPVGVGDIASVLWFALGRASTARPVILLLRSTRSALRLMRR